MNKKRNVEFDGIRALCMLWIVGFWHMPYYCPDVSFIENSALAGYITNGVLACFMLISGIFCGKRKIDNFDDVKGFLISRVIRFWPLFVLSCISLSLIGVFEIKTAILTIFGVACFTGESPLTVWFLSMLIPLYILTPFVTYRKNLKKMLIKILFIFGGGGDCPKTGHNLTCS